MSAPVDCEPPVALPPDQPPDAVQAVALAEDHESTELAAEAMVLGFALKVTLGSGELTDTVADWLAVPPSPVQVRV